MDKANLKIESVSANGSTIKVRQILALNIYDEDIDLEFLDEKGNYHHYQSWHDKGKVIYAN